MKMKSGMVDLPLFPLNTVLFPGQTLPLHIFEPRYRSMIQYCIENKSPFGVVLADEETGVPYRVGTLARITNVKRLSDGRMNIMCVGTERFKVSNIRLSENEYFLGDVTKFPLDKTIKLNKDTKRKAVKRLSTYLKLLAKVNDLSFKLEEYPRTTSELALFTAIVLQLPLEHKQELLMIPSVSDLIEQEQNILSKEIFTLNLMAKAAPPPNDMGEFSRN
jgi:Lon protease-like protein